MALPPALSPPSNEGDGVTLVVARALDVAHLDFGLVRLKVNLVSMVESLFVVFLCSIVCHSF